ncbi:phycobilisome rod-core linker polypeptide [Cyanobium sp. Morenito 9A2]|uniref:phycobilisome rod-core linker polypeptide n=1 Tax=Cyanobium sp. Morenito 9A2 TaxID=2823718 RepID=UPI0020CE60B9|nr:phycobilisome rod-core linker polypeptide [Cyanobium sp. Morenito 9A2]MCP9851173.1 phycobilisome rod-core linker polypeptide [Cyanobium sp. Morenito 9A2]
MALPLLETRPVTQNARVESFLIGNDESPRRLPDGGRPNPEAFDELIERSYRQIFFHAFKVDREPVLESQLRSGSINTRDFVRGLLLSRRFREGFYRVNSNYRLVEQLIGRVLGRDVHGDQERIAWSIVIAEQGLQAFVDALLESDEYLENFGYDEVPHQRSRVLPGHAKGNLPFNQKAPRYDAYWRDITARRAPADPFGDGSMSPAWVGGEPPAIAKKIWLAFLAIGALEVGRVLLTTAAAILSTG